MAGTYKRTFLEQVIARLDFASDLPIKESLPDTVARETIKRFPISGLVKKWLILGNSSERMSTIAKDWQ